MNKQLKIVIMSLMMVGGLFVGMHILHTFFPWNDTTSEETLGPVAMAYRGKLNSYEIIVDRTEINIAEFVNKRGEHCMVATRNGEIELICENH